MGEISRFEQQMSSWQLKLGNGRQRKSIAQPTTVCGIKKSTPTKVNLGMCFSCPLSQAPPKASCGVRM